MEQCRLYCRIYPAIYLCFPSRRRGKYAEFSTIILNIPIRPRVAGKTSRINMFINLFYSAIWQSPISLTNFSLQLRPQGL